MKLTDLLNTGTKNMNSAKENQTRIITNRQLMKLPVNKRGEIMERGIAQALRNGYEVNDAWGE